MKLLKLLVNAFQWYVGKTLRYTFFIILKPISMIFKDKELDECVDRALDVAEEAGKLVSDPAFIATSLILGGTAGIGSPGSSTYTLNKTIADKEREAGHDYIANKYEYEAMKQVVKDIKKNNKGE